MSFGVATIKPYEGGRKEELIASADKALYAAKNKGRDQVWPKIPMKVMFKPAE